ncbi:MAG: ATP-binding protein [Allisonella histaminiformans]|uniref:sensor histidine kinase n=1 Tax=Allisonella histaminiformans TaxID=209880 RepID=UPI0023542F5B|nr:ATP-binding protein [Allisonella histaminiformans]MCI6003059.1 ATP-binding protein [Allisonella histaminiformans]
MRKQIQRSLFFMGLVAVLVSFLMSAVLYYQGMQQQRIHELEMTTYAASRALSEKNKEYSISYLKQLYKENNISGIHIVWLNKDGQVLYDSAGPLDEDYIAQSEVKTGMEEGSSFSIHKSVNGIPKEYYTHKAPDGTLLRLSSVRSLNLSMFNGYIPGMILFIIVFSVGAVLVANKKTEEILSPLGDMSVVISRIMSGEKNVEIPGQYIELKPVLDTVKELHRQADAYLENLEEDRKMMQAVQDSISNGLIVLNSQKEILDYNVKAARIFHIEGNRRYRKISVIFHDEDWLRAISRAYHNTKSQEYTMTLYDTPYMVLMTPLRLFDNENGLLIVLRDLSAQYAAEKMRREFSANVSHELKTPLTSISGFGEMIANGMYANEADVRMFGQRIYSEAQRMVTLINTILHLSKLEENDTTITWGMVNMEEVVKYVVDIISPQAHHRGVTVLSETEPVYVHGNHSLLSELLVNLLDNAVKYNRQNGQVSVKLSKTADNHMVLTVSDTGIGIPKDKQNRIFERFYRVESSRSKETGGTGLGLAMCKHIISRHHGTVTLDSVEGRGTTITVTMPCLSAQEVSIEEGNAKAAHEEAEQAKKLALEEERKKQEERIKEKQEALARKKQESSESAHEKKGKLKKSKSKKAEKGEETRKKKGKKKKKD